MSGSRVTPERMVALVAHYARIQGLTGRAKPGTDWSFGVEVVPGLTDPRSGANAWAVVVPKPNPKTDGGSAHVRVRDIDATPIPGFDGDAMLEIRVTISHELFHCIVAEATRGGALTIPAEEMIVEAAAQAVVRSEGTADARVMARSTSAIPGALRARVAMKISARAATRARGGTMDGKAVLAAIKDQDEAGALSILETWAAEQIAAAQGAPAPVEPDGDEGMAPVEAREETPMDDPTKRSGAAPAGPPAARPMARAIDIEAARARKASDSLNRSAIRARIHEVRVVEGIELDPALETMILAEPDIDGAEKLIRAAKLAKGTGTRARAETAARPAGTPPPAAKKKYDAADLVKEGIHPQMAEDIANETDPDAAELSLKAARARIAKSTPTWPTTQKPGGVS